MAAFLSLSAVCASDVNETDTIATTNDDTVSESQDVSLKSQELIGTSSQGTSSSTYVKDSKFRIKILDENGTGIAHKKLTVTVKDKTYNYKTNKNGNVYLKLSSKGTYDISYLFNESGYAPLAGHKKVTVVGNSTSKITGSSYSAYEGFKNTYSVKLSAGGVALPKKKVIFKLNGNSYIKKTNSNGKASLDINLTKGTYKIRFIFEGLNHVDPTKGSAKITIKKGMPTKITRLSSLLVREKVSTPFKVKYTDVNGNPLNHKAIILTINGKTYKEITNAKGIAKFYINENKGVYPIKVNSYTNSKYLKSINTYTIISKPSYAVNNGFWLFGSDMKSVNLKTVAKYGVNQIFLNAYAVKVFGKSEVAKFATEAKSLGINVHIWMQAFYNNGAWTTPVDGNGKYKYSLFNSIIKEAKSYAAIKGVAGIHFDYLRFSGTAYKYVNGVNAINYFTKKACDELHAYNPKLIMSAAVMPEPSSMKYYYGQDIPTISKYLDVIVPMVYTGNYGGDEYWVKSMTESFISMSNGAEIWTGLQGYYSDSNVNKLPASTLKHDADFAAAGGAHGIIVFRYNLFNLFNFNDI